MLLVYAGSAKPDQVRAVEEIVASIQARYGGHIRPYAIVEATATGNLFGFVRLPVLQDADGAFRRTYHTTTTSALLIRPDGYIAYRCAPVRSDCLTKYLERIFC